MAKVMKKLSALLLAFAMVITMMPALSLTAFAEDGDAIHVYVNGIDTGNGVTAQWMVDNSIDAQVFPFAAKEGGTWNYVVAQGPSYDAVLMETLGYESLEDIIGAQIVWRSAEGVEVNKNGLNTLNVEDLINATDQFKLINADTGEEITGPFKTVDFDVKVAPVENAPAITPIIATKQSKGSVDYASAVAALGGGEWASGTSIRPYLGGNLDKDQFLRVQEQENPINSGSVNFTGRFSMADNPQLNIKIDVPAESDMIFDGPDADTQTAEINYPVSNEVNAALAENAEWETTDEAVATVEKGVVTPTGVGSCTVTAKGDDQTVAAVYNVTVNKPEQTLFSVYLNGTETGKSITDKWMEENSIEAQVFPFAAKEGGTWNYVVAQGPSYEAVLKEALAIESLDEIRNAQIVWRTAEGVEINKNGLNTLNVEDLINATDQFKLINANTGEEITGPFNNVDFDVKVAPVENAPAITPIIATKQSKGSADYASAVAALEGGEWANGTSIRPYLGGNLNKDVYLRVQEQEKPINSGSVNFTGRFSMADNPQLNVKIVAETNVTSLTFTKTTAKSVPAKYTEKEMEFLGGVTWKSSNSKIAVVSRTGKVTPKGIGKCTVTATLADGTVVEKCSVTVKTAAFTPAIPGSFKAVNVKTRSAKLTWKKVTGATGYQVYRSRKKSSGFKRIATFKKNTTVRYTNKKCRKGRTYYYKIRAYRTVNGKTVYGKFTTVKSVKIKK